MKTEILRTPGNHRVCGRCWRKLPLRAGVIDHEIGVDGATVECAATGYYYLVLGPNSWAKAPTIVEARRRAKKHHAKVEGPFKTVAVYEVRVGVETVVDALGRVTWPYDEGNGVEKIA